jgi:hypothetical protein
MNVKGANFHASTAVVSGSLGAALGLALGYLVGLKVERAKSEQALSSRLTEETNRLRTHYDTKLKDAIQHLVAREDGHPYVGPPSMGDPEPDTGTDEPDEVHEDSVEVRDWPPADRNVNRPYVLSFEEFFDDEPDYTKVQLTWYEGDKVLADDKDQPVAGARTAVGVITKDSFGGPSNDPNVMYVRNDKLMLDSEIVINFGKYSEIVLGYGDPSSDDGS